MKGLSFGAALLAGFWLSGANAGPALTIRGAWIPEAPATASVQAAYMELVNDGSVPLVVVGAQSSDFGRVEMHRTIQAAGVARMEAQQRLPIDAGARLVLTPGGLHLMLIEPKRRLVAGDRVGIELRLEDGTPVSTTAEVRSDGPSADHDHRHAH
ncbi:MAG: copper chaperone PCu(A)C [Gammaproteobacteria bacterium]|jgi:copper(I)-binding protein|nr:copper chaperone PCu(A)C [Gammaproteobacteria bacterium]